LADVVKTALSILMSPEQCRAARAWLDISQKELADAAEVATSTIKDFESGRRTPMAKNLGAIRVYLETRGVRFVVDGESAGLLAPVSNAPATLTA
jgi:predicted transcriptional regulator